MSRAAILVAGALIAAPALAEGLDATMGRARFERAWTPAPASTRASDGLGPHFDARACAACHPGLDRPVVVGLAAPAAGMAARLSDAQGRPDPVYGRQLQTQAATGLSPEAKLRLRAERRPGDPGPRWRVEARGLRHGALAKGVILSARLAPPLFGLAGLEAPPDAALHALAAAQAAAPGPVKGRVSLVDDGSGAQRAGRFGFKAQDPDLIARIAGAFHADMGMSSALRPMHGGDCTTHQRDCRAAPHGAPDRVGPHEIDASTLGQIAAFLRDRPAPAPPSPPSREGAAIFARIGCAQCHVEAPGAAFGEAAKLWSDLLLHDLGPRLAGATEGAARPQDWRTAPLIGLGAGMAKGRRLLHDGRARTLGEAIGWHDGEARPARLAHDALTAADRTALAAFLSGL